MSSNMQVGYAAPFVATGEYSFGNMSGQNNKFPISKTSKPVSIYTDESATIAQKKVKELKNRHEETQKINNMVMPFLFKKGATQEEIHSFLDKYKDNPLKTAQIIANMIIKSAIGCGTNEEGMSAAIYYINKETYPLVQKTLAKEGLSIESIMHNELSPDEAKDLHRHLNQFKK